jgi:hypothetical protein
VALGTPRRGRGEQITLCRRLTAVSVAVTAAVLAVAGTLTPALATTGPSIFTNHGSVNIAVDGAR